MSMFTDAAEVIAARTHKDLFTILRPTTTQGAEGGKINGPPTSLGTHKGNAQPYTAELALKDYGMEVKASVRIYALPDARLQLGRLIVCEGETYRITALPMPRSMAVILAEKVKP